MGLVGLLHQPHCFRVRRILRHRLLHDPVVDVVRVAQGNAEEEGLIVLALQKLDGSVGYRPIAL